MMLKFQLYATEINKNVIYIQIDYILNCNISQRYSFHSIFIK